VKHHGEIIATDGVSLSVDKGRFLMLATVLFRPLNKKFHIAKGF